jgi:hypothetical protein
LGRFIGRFERNVYISAPKYNGTDCAVKKIRLCGVAKGDEFDEHPQAQ